VARAVAEAITARDGRLRVEHVGSSSVPGLGGKGYVDLVVLYPDGALDAAKDVLAALGFQRQRGRDPWPETRPLRLGQVEHAGRSYPVNAHVVAASAGEVAELLTFRDRLRADPALQRAYEAEKRDLAGGVLDGVDYAEKKSGFVRRVLADLSMRAVGLEPMTDAEIAHLAAIAGPYAAARAAADHVSLDAAADFSSTVRDALPDGPSRPAIASSASWRRRRGHGGTRGFTSPRRRSGTTSRSTRSSAPSVRHERAHVVESIARDAGCRRRVERLADNPGAMALYHILGFQTVSRHLNKVIRDGG
jgi:GrpB-like predicted nucleotidyltransferase (UPF0157 family)